MGLVQGYRLQVRKNVYEAICMDGLIVLKHTKPIWAAQRFDWSAIVRVPRGLFVAQIIHSSRPRTTRDDDLGLHT